MGSPHSGRCVSTPHSATSTRRRFIGAAAAGWLASLRLGNAAPQARAAVAPSPPAARPATGADIGSLFGFVDAQAAHDGFDLSFLQPRFKSLPRWRSLAKRRVLDLLHYSPAPCDPQPEIVDRADRGNHVLETVRLNTTAHSRIPAFVLVPKTASAAKPAPAIVALHDHGGFYLWGKEKLVAVPGENPVLTDFKATYYGGRNIAEELVARGYVVIVIDMFYWGERRMLLDGDPADWVERPPGLSRERIQAFNARASQSEALMGRTIYAAGFTWPGVIFWDDIRTVDYLASRPDVDASRIGCVGLSVGGLRSCHLAALDERIKAAVAVGWMASFPWQLKTQVRHTIGHTKLIPGLYKHLDYPDVAALAMPRPLLVINGSRDALFHPEGVRLSFQKLHACYAKAGAPHQIKTRLYDTPHEFNTAMQTEAWDWLGRWV